MFVGLVGAFVSGVIIDVTKNFEGVAKVMCAFALICFIWFLEVRISFSTYISCRYRYSISFRKCMLTDTYKMLVNMFSLCSFCNVNIAYTVEPQLSEPLGTRGGP